MELYYIKIVIISYLIGSIPTSYLLVKFFSGKNIDEEGSGNIGAMNSFEVTGKKYIGILAFILDAAKGSIAVLITILVFFPSTILSGLALIFAMLGHNWSIFLKFKGGRGLSTAVGGFLTFNPFTIPIWLIMFWTSRTVVSHNVHINNVVASLLTILLVWKAPIYAIWHTKLISNFNVEIYQIFTTIVCIIIIISHYKPLLDLFKKPIDYKKILKL